jgi:hypothetical protein
MTNKTDKTDKRINNNKKAKKEHLNSFVIMKRYRDNKEYSGEFKNNKRNGWGIMTFEFFEGRYDTNSIYYRFPDYSNTIIYPYAWVIYSGNWKNGDPHGDGKLIFPDDSYCVGIWKKGYITEGEFKYNDGRIYKGDFSKMHYTDLFHITPFRHGYGIMYENDGNKKYEGWWKSIPCEFSIASIFLNKCNHNVEKIKEFGTPCYDKSN